MRQIESQIWLSGGYVLKFHFDEDKVENAFFIKQDIGLGRDPQLGEHEEHDFSIWNWAGELITGLNIEFLSVPNQKILAYSLPVV